MGEGGGGCGVGGERKRGGGKTEGREDEDEDRLRKDPLCVFWYSAGVCYGLQGAMSGAGGGSY